MVEFETLDIKEIKFGNNKFLEVARKVAKTEQGENEFISISKGFITPNGQKRFKNALGFPADKEIMNGLIGALQGIMETVPEEPTKAVEETPAAKEAPKETEEVREEAAE
ncbi:MAG: hypothetical protein ACE5J4_00920 [Candidatus Aenigmatarchaeota archaeon]